MKVYVQKIILDNYRNFEELSLDVNSTIVVILGNNGSGKTNILESISMLSPGKGIRFANHDEIAKNQAGYWSSSIEMQSKIGKAQIKYSLMKNSKLRSMEYNGAKIKNHDLIKIANIIWLTPQMEGVFLSPASDRRRFLDRMVFNFFQNHAANLNKYNKLTSERLKILTNHFSHNDLMLNSLEKKIAELALDIFIMRNKALAFIEEEINILDTDFPKAKLAIKALFEEDLANNDFIKNYLLKLSNNRKKDGITKRTNFGINKQELIVKHSKTGQLAKYCSTGEQKALLISILLGQIEASINIAKTTPILLLDELFVHLDDERKKSLAEYIIKSKLQTFITATDLAGLDEIAKIAQIVKIG